jgi:hypothetical protein
MTRALYFSQASGGRQTQALQLWDRETAHRNQRPELYDRPRVRSRVTPGCPRAQERVGRIPRDASVSVVSSVAPRRGGQAALIASSVCIIGQHVCVAGSLPVRVHPNASKVLNAPSERWAVSLLQEKIKIVNQEAYDKFMAKINEFSTKTAQIRQVLSCLAPLARLRRLRHVRALDGGFRSCLRWLGCRWR